MAVEKAYNLPDASRPISAVEGTWPIEEWPIDVQRVDENGIDLSLIEESLSLTPTERLMRVEQLVGFVLEAWRNQGFDIDACINFDNSSNS